MTVLFKQAQPRLYEVEAEARMVAEELSKEAPKGVRYIHQRCQEKWAVERQIKTEYWSYDRYVPISEDLK